GRFEESIAKAFAPLLRDNERLIDQLSEKIDYFGHLKAPARSDRLGRFQRPATREYRQSAEQSGLALAQQPVAPVKRPAERLLTRKRGAATRGQKAQPIVNSLGHFLYGDGLDAGCGELDRQGNAVQLIAEGCDGRDIPVRERESGERGVSAIEEQPDGFVL